MTRSTTFVSSIVLSKLRHAHGRETVTAVPKADLNSFAASVGVSELTPISGGTLGAVFLFRSDGKCRFAKTYTITSGASALSREGRILQSLYGERLGLDQLQIGDRLWLVMRALSQLPAPLDPTEVLRLNAWLAPRLNGPVITAAVPPDEHFGRFLFESRRALAALIDGSHLGFEAENIAASSLDCLERELPECPLVVCHGDLSAANIMCDDCGPVVIDWEDAFWGIEGYDYLFWLTFMAQRTHYSPAMFGRTPWRREVEISVLISIILLKSYVAILNGSHVHHSLSFDRRILEIAAFG